jgi:hypothetical protein
VAAGRKAVYTSPLNMFNALAARYDARMVLLPDGVERGLEEFCGIASFGPHLRSKGILVC